MLKTLVLLGVFLFIVSSGVVIRDWDNPDDEVLVNDDNIIDENYKTFTSPSPQCSTSSDCNYIKSSSNHNPYELFQLDQRFEQSNKNPYQEKQLLEYKEVSNG